MKCPVCPETTLVMTARQEIEIDYCPKCRGVWLDRGELDKLIERSGTAKSIQDIPRVDPYRKDHDDDDYKKYSHKRRKSFLSEIFD